MKCELNTTNVFQENELENVCKMAAILFMPRFVNGLFEQTEIRWYNQVQPRVFNVAKYSQYEI